jgi:hypothetical protein
MEKGMITDELRKKEEHLGYTLDYFNSIIHTTVEEALKLVKEKKITWEQWFAPIKAMDKQ